jgi:hypothetical protein
MSLGVARFTGGAHVNAACDISEDPYVSARTIPRRSSFSILTHLPTPRLPLPPLRRDHGSLQIYKPIQTHTDTHTYIYIYYLPLFVSTIYFRHSTISVLMFSCLKVFSTLPCILSFLCIFISHCLPSDTFARILLSISSSLRQFSIKFYFKILHLTLKYSHFDSFLFRFMFTRLSSINFYKSSIRSAFHS